MSEFDITKFLSVTPEIGPLVVLTVLGLVAYLGELGVKGKLQLISAMLIGLLFGGAFLIALVGVPATFAGWFLVILAGLSLGLIASGVYQAGKGMVIKALARQLGDGDKGQGLVEYALIIVLSAIITIGIMALISPYIFNTFPLIASTLGG